MLEIDRPGLSYEYDTIVFFLTKDRKVYYAYDSGCSCPTPFEAYSGENAEECIKYMEEVRDHKHGIELIQRHGWASTTENYREFTKFWLAIQKNKQD